MLKWQRNARRALSISSCRLQYRVHHEEEEEEDVENLALCDTVTTFCTKGQLVKAVELMQQHDSLLPPATYWSLLKLCNERSSLHHAKHVHAHMDVHHMPPTSITLNEYLVLTFCKCGDLKSAILLFYSLPVRTVFSWTAIISGHTDHGECMLALQVYASMLEECVLPNEYTYVSLLKACGSVPNLQIGKAIHARAWKDGLHSHAVFASSLVSMYSKCGAIEDAERAFCATPQHDVVSWTSMITVLIEHEFQEKAMIMYRQMQEQGVAPNEWTISACLQGCCILAEKHTLVLEGEPVPLELGRALHKDATARGLEGQAFVGNNLLRMYGKCGCMFEAENVFCYLWKHDVVSWTAMLSLYVEQSEAEKAFKAYRQMVEACVNPDKLAILTALQACCILTALEFNSQQPSRVSALEIGQALHANARRKGLAADAYVGNTLAHLFAKCGKYAEAEMVFVDLRERDVVSWTVMLPAYIEQGQAKKALQLYQQMQNEGVSPDEQTLTNVLQACCKYADEELEEIEGEVCVPQVALEVGRALHNDALERGYHHSLCISSVLVTLYGKCGAILEAAYSFKKLPQPDALAHAAILSAYVKGGQRKKALQLYTDMITEGINFDDAINGCMLESCRLSRSVTGCRLMHHSILWNANSSVCLGLATRLIFVYSSCGSPLDAQAILNLLSAAADVVTWNALMSGCIQSGDYIGAFKKLEDMRGAGINPNQATFLSLLSACCQAGLIQKGVEYFELMSRLYGVAPGIQHYGCMIVLLGRIGDFGKIDELLSTMQVQPDIAMWLSLLGACQVHGNVELGKHAYERAVCLQPRQAAAYVLMSNIYANAGMQDQANEVNMSRKEASAWKKPGQSWISINGLPRTFIVGKESMVPQEESFTHALQQKQLIWRQEGYIPQIDY